MACQRLISIDRQHLEDYLWINNKAGLGNSFSYSHNVRLVFKTILKALDTYGPTLLCYIWKIHGNIGETRVIGGVTRGDKHGVELKPRY